jgi:hypothetical protein
MTIFRLNLSSSRLLTFLAIGCLGYQSIYFSPELLNSLVEHLIKETQGSKKLEHSRTYTATLAAIRFLILQPYNIAICK